MPAANERTKIFIVHGHDTAALEQLELIRTGHSLRAQAKFVSNLEPVLLSATI